LDKLSGENSMPVEAIGAFCAALLSPFICPYSAAFEKKVSIKIDNF
jgi:hypothetical protein